MSRKVFCDKCHEEIRTGELIIRTIIDDKDVDLCVKCRDIIMQERIKND